MRAYERLFARCHGKSVSDDTREFLEYRQARAGKRHFRDLGREAS
jgi:hypothetical protein